MSNTENEPVPPVENPEKPQDATVESEEQKVENQETKDWNPVEEVVQIDAALAENKKLIEQARADLASNHDKLKKIRESLGLPPGDGDAEPLAEKARLEDLLAEQEKLEGEQKEAEAAEDLNKVLEVLNELPPAELLIIIETGKGPDGKELMGKNGKIDPDVAKELGKLAQEGIKKITKAIMKGVLVIVKGVLSGIFHGMKEGASEGAAESAG